MSAINDAPHTIDAQLKHLEGLIRARQEQLKNDQLDTDLALSDDQPAGSDNAWSGHHRRFVMPIEGEQ